MRKTQRGITVAILTVGLLLALVQPARADIIRGLGKIIGGVFQIPLSTLSGTFSGPPIVGTLFGALGGAFNGLGMITDGALEIVGDAVPLAQSVAPLVLPFLL